MATAAEESNKLHTDADVDTSPSGMHHTLGLNANQAAAGNHLHDERYSNIMHNHDQDYKPADAADVGNVNQIATEAPTQRPDGKAIAVGDLWIDSDVSPSIAQVATYYWDNFVTINQTPAATPAPIASWVKAVWTAPSTGTVVITLNGRVDSGAGSMGAAGDNIRVYIGWQVNNGAVLYDSQAGWAEVFQPFTGRFITAISSSTSFQVTAETQIKFFPIAGVSRAGIWDLGFPVMRLQFFPAAQHQALIGATS